MLKGIVFICNNSFEIEQYIYNSFDDIKIIDKNEYFGNMCDSMINSKVNEFTKLMKSDGVVFDWELNVLFSNYIKPLKFSGSIFNENYFIFALEANSDVPFLYEELMFINNEQSNYIRRILKDRFMTEALSEESMLFDEMTKLNNELSNLQRELSKKNVELKKLNELKNQFLGMAAHDLRNPLGHIYNYAELLEEQLGEINDDQMYFLNVIKKQSQFMLNLVSDLLNFSVIESGKISLRLEKINLINLIEDILQFERKIAEKRSIVIDFLKPKEQIITIIDPDKISQVFSNLIGNAIKYSNENTEVRIEVIDNGSEILVTVKDQGIGIGKEYIDKLFKPFQTTGNRSKSGERSIGLGLFISKSIIEAHQGKIWVESSSDNGTKFKFTIKKHKPDIL